MNTLINKSYRDYEKISRYNNFPYYYDYINNKYIYGTTAWLNENTPFFIHIVKHGDTIDKLSLQYYNNPSQFWIICDFNRITDAYMELEEGMELKIPTLSSIEYIDSLR